MAMQLLLQVLQELEEEEFMKFKFFLKDPALKPQIPQGDLDDASRQNIAKFMVQHYTNRALVMARKMLEQIPHLELVERFQLPQDTGATSSLKHAPAPGRDKGSCAAAGLAWPSMGPAGWASSQGDWAQERGYKRPFGLWDGFSF